MLEHRQLLTADPFSFTAQGARWLDHEWLFQILLALLERCGGVTAVICGRCLLVAGLALLLFSIGVRSGLSPASAHGLVVLCIFGARMRFFLRPELCTMLAVPITVWLFFDLRDKPGWSRVAAIAAVVALAVNLHAAALVIPILVAGLFAAELARMILSRAIDRARVGRLAAAAAAAAAAPVLNPHGWLLWAVPFKITGLVGQAHIPNPEWISPGFSDVPVLYLALAGAVVLLAARERDLVRWALLLAAAALALRYVRNVGIFFVLLPLVVAPALARVPLLAATPPTRAGSRWLAPVLAGTLSAVVVASFFLTPFHPLGWGLSPAKYPIQAVDFLARSELLGRPLYNDVNFGGYLIGRLFPAQQVFLDDRNEIHDRLLAEIFSILQASDVGAWQDLLDRFGVDVALVRYHPPLQVLTPAGAPLGERGFSTLWFPRQHWALLYWDDVAMVFLRRERIATAAVAYPEYTLLRPDDVRHLAAEVAAGRVDRGRLAGELRRKLAEDPGCWRALEMAQLLGPPQALIEP
jgi:hypothetical protein